MAVRNIKLSPLAQETGNLTDAGVSSRRRNRNLVRDNKGNSTLIDQTATSITLLASSVTEIDGRVTENEAELVIQAGQIATKVSQTDFNELGGRVSTAETNITQNATAIALKASQSEVNSLGARVTTAESTLTIQAGQIATKVSTTDLNNTLTNYSTITQTANAIQSTVSTATLNSANSATDAKLSNYSTITQTSTAIALEFGNTAKHTAINGISVLPQGWRNGLGVWSNPFTEVSQGSCSVVPGANYGLNNGLNVIQFSGVTFARSGYIPHEPDAEYFIDLYQVFFQAGSGTLYVGVEYWEDIGVSTQENNGTNYAIIHPITSYGTIGSLSASVYSNGAAQRKSKYVRIRVLTHWGGTGSNTMFQNIIVRKRGIPTQMQGARYVFDGEYATFYNGGLRIRNNAGTTVFDADTSGNLRLTGQITADTGNIADFSLINNYATVVSGTSGKAITGGSGSNRVGMSPGITTGGFVYSFWAGNDNPINAPFRVLRNGGLRSTDAVIAGWTMSGSTISKGNLELDASSSNGRITIGGSVLFSNSTNRLSLTGALAVSGVVTVGQVGVSLIPTTNNLYSLGTSPLRWQTVWISTSAINGSDRRLKDDIKEIDFATDFILNLKPVQFKLIDGQSGRKHYGFIAQEVKETMTKVGIDDFGGYIDPNTTKTEDEEEQMLGLRYEEFIAPMVATIQSLEKRIQQLEKGVLV